MRRAIVVFICLLCIMEMFSLQNFVTNPSLEQINSSRKQDLLLIADHYKIVVSKQGLKRDIKSKLLQHLCELNVLPMSNTVDSESSGNVGAGDVAVANLSLMNDEDKRSSRADAEEEVMADAKASLPQFDPLTPSTVDSRDRARLKIRICNMRHKRKLKHIRLS